MSVGIERPEIIASGSDEPQRWRRDRRRSSSLSRTVEDISRAERKRLLRSHTISTLCLCSCVLSMFYLLMSPFPYSGFMAACLVPGLDHDNVGAYAGMLSSSFMVGRAFSSLPWGVAADRYGRKFVLLLSLPSSAVLSVAFGFSMTYRWALAVRFLMGFGNGTMQAVRTMVSELAGGDKELEAKGMGLVMSMVGYGMLIGPSVGGMLSDPMKQYPDAHWFGGSFDVVLANFPYVLPNLIGAVMCALSMILVWICVEETLPDDKRRDGMHFVGDVVIWLTSTPARLWDGISSVCFSGRTVATGETKGERTRLVIWSDRTNGSARDAAPADDDDDDDDGRSAADDDLKILEAHECSELSALLSSESSRASYSSAMHRPRRPSAAAASYVVRRPSAAAVAEKDRLGSVPDRNMGEGRTAARPSSSSSLLSNRSTRDHLVAWWANSLVSVTISEAFPLFCMSEEGGLDLSESTIGGISAAAGVVLCACQYFVFSFSLKRLGLYGSARVGSFLSGIPAALTPLSLLLMGSPHPGGASYAAYAFLATLMAVEMVFNSNFYAAITIATNRTVDASQRATLNGLSGIGASVGRGLGPILAGSLVSFSMSSGVIPPRFGSVVVYTVIAAMGLCAFWFTYSLEGEEEEEEEDAGTSRGGSRCKNGEVDEENGR